jgi:hypothetical protein
VVVSSPFGSIASSNATLTVDLFPIIVAQPQSQTVQVGSNVTFVVSAQGAASVLPVVSSGTLQLWLRADEGVVTNSAGLVSQWQDQSGNANHASQSNANQRPRLISDPGLGGRPALLFNGIQDNVNGSYLTGSGQVAVPKALTAFTIYNPIGVTLTNENLLWDLGVPNAHGANRACDIDAGYMTFSFWSYWVTAPVLVPTNTYRLCTDRLDTNLDTVSIFDATANSATNFTLTISGGTTLGAGYSIGGLYVPTPGVGVATSRCFDGEIVETIIYSGYLSEADRLAVTGYLEQKYFQDVGKQNLSYQWQWNGTNIANATNTTLVLTNVQGGNDGTYTVIVSNGVAVTTSSNAVLTVGWPPQIIGQPASQSVELDCSATFNVSAISAAPLSYQWWDDGVALVGETNYTLTINSVRATNVGNYLVTVSNVLGVTNSKAAVLNLAQPPVANPVTVQRLDIRGFSWLTEAKKG